MARPSVRRSVIFKAENASAPLAGWSQSGQRPNPSLGSVGVVTQKRSQPHFACIVAATSSKAVLITHGRPTTKTVSPAVTVPRSVKIRPSARHAALGIQRAGNVIHYRPESFLFHSPHPHDQRRVPSIAIQDRECSSGDERRAFHRHHHSPHTICVDAR